MVDSIARAVSVVDLVVMFAHRVPTMRKHAACAQDHTYCRQSGKEDGTSGTRNFRIVQIPALNLAGNGSDDVESNYGSNFQPGRRNTRSA